MAATIGLVLDCNDPNDLARFWSEALGYSTVGSAGNYVMLVDTEGVRPKLLLQGVPEAKICPRTGCTSTSRHPTSTARHPASSHSAPGDSRRECATSTERTGSSWPIPKVTNSVSVMAGPAADTESR